MVSRTRGANSAAEFGAAVTAAAAPLAWTTITDSECATMSCSSLAIRARSAAATTSAR